MRWACTLVVLAKAPAPGRSKTRCCPPCTFEQAAEMAAAALHDTLVTVAATPARRRVLVLDGLPGRWLPPGFEIVAQRGAGLDQRLAAAFDDVGEPSVLIGMDTPQVTASMLIAAQQVLASDGVDAVLGPAEDGGYWLVGLEQPNPVAFIGVPMSTPRTGRAQHSRLVTLGLRVSLLPPLRDVDTFADAMEVAAMVPGSGFGQMVARLTPLTTGGCRPDCVTVGQ